MLTDKELQSLRNMGNESESAAGEIEMLRARVVELAALVPIAEAAERERCAKALRLQLRGHRYQDGCPDEVNGWASRDPKCKACRALMEFGA